MDSQPAGQKMFHECVDVYQGILSWKPKPSLIRGRLKALPKSSEKEEWWAPVKEWGTSEQEGHRPCRGTEKAKSEKVEGDDNTKRQNKQEEKKRALILHLAPLCSD